MPKRPPRPRHLFSEAFWLALPLAAALGAAAAAGWLRWWQGAALLGAVLLGQGLWLWRALRALAAAAELAGRGIEAGAGEIDGLDARARLFGAGEDIARALARARREAARREPSELAAVTLGRVMEALPQPVLLLGAARRIRRTNAAVERLFGDRGEGRDVAALLRDPAVMNAIDAALADGAPRDVDFRMHHPAERDLRAYLRPVGDAASEWVLLVTIDDLTMQRRTDAMRSDFVANVSHELRTPLSSLIGFIETLRGPASEDPGARERFLEIMEEQAARMAGLIGDLTSLSRIELAEHEPPTETVEIVPILQALMESLQPQAAQRHIRFRLSLPEDGEAAPPRVVGDRDQLYQVVQNLLTNALKYGAESSVVTIAVGGAAEAPVEHARPAGRRHAARETVTALPAARAGRFVTISVSDEGEGIAEEHLSRLTERFYRVDSARSRALGGTGLGLAIVKHILARHRGRLDIESAPGKGSTFTVFLPDAASDARAAQAGQAAAQ